MRRVSLGRRFVALALDWLMSYAIVLALNGGLGGSSSNREFSVLALFFTEVLLLSALQGASAGHRMVGIRIVRFSDKGAITPKQALIRTVLLCLVVTAITYDDDGRGIHERLSNTVLIRR
jgi:uncharacterized RDD family membrane protein YckC